MAESFVSIQLVNADAVKKHLREHGATLRPRIATIMRETMQKAVTHGRTHELSGGAGQLHVRTGRLRRSFRFRVRRRQTGVTGQLGFLGRGVGYAWVQEYGATIRPKNARYLIVPQAGALTRTGRLRALAGRRQRGQTYVRGRVVYERRGRVSVPLFLLTRQVVVPARPTLAPTWQRFRPQLMTRLRDDMLNPSVKG
jgi:hypothetical protein